MKVKFAGRVYDVMETRTLPGGLVQYGIEDEPNHIDWLSNVEIVCDDNRYGFKSDDASYPTKPVCFDGELDYNFVEHFNKWWWGSTFTIIAGEGIGTVELQIDNNYPSIAFVKGLSVLETEKRKGLGKKLMEHCISIAIRERKMFIQLSVNKEQEWLVAWYKRMGFVTIQLDEHEFTMLRSL